MIVLLALVGYRCLRNQPCQHLDDGLLLFLVQQSPRVVVRDRFLQNAQTQLHVGAPFRHVCPPPPHLPRPPYAPHHPRPPLPPPTPPPPPPPPPPPAPPPPP